MEVVTLKREQLREPSLPIRVQMDEEKLESLAADIRAVGILYPLIVYPRGFRLKDGTFVDELDETTEDEGNLRAYEIADGHRRYIAAGMAGVADLPCIIKTGERADALGDMVRANLEREDNTAAEEGWLYLRCCDEYQWGIDQLMRVFHKSEAYINDRVRLVSTDGEVAKAVATRQINFAVAKALCRCSDEAHRRYLLSLAITHGSNARTAEVWVQQWKTNAELTIQPVAGNGTHTVGEYVAPPAPVCLWCEKDRDREALVQVVLHRWHLADLLDWMEKAGIRSRVTSS